MLQDNDFRALIEQAHQLDDLTKHPGWAVLVDFIKTTIEGPRVNGIINGNLETLEKYKYETGYCLGLNAVLRAPQIVGDKVLTERKERAIREEAEAA